MARPGHVYHWKHGWIPITPRAAMIKAKGHRGLAERIMHDQHITDRRTSGERRTGPLKPDTGGHRTGTAYKRGDFTYKPGTKTKDYPDRAPQREASPGGPAGEREAFRMGRKELEGHAANGNPHAQRELERRAAKHGKPAPTPPPAPKATKPAPAPKPEAPAAPKPLADVDDEALAREVHRRGGFVDGGGKFIPGRANRTGDLPERNPDLDGRSDEELARELFRRGGAVDVNGKHLPGGSAVVPGSPRHLSELEAQNRTIELGLPADHRLEAKRIDDPVTGNFRGVLVAHHVGDERIGAVVLKDDKFTARYQGATIGVFDSRVQAHLALAKRHAEVAPDAPHVPFGADLDTEDARINAGLPQGESVKGAMSKRFIRNDYGGRDTVPVVRSTHFSGGRTLGYATGDGAGKFTAEHRFVPVGRKTSKYADLGTFDSREAAHKAISDAEAAHQAKVAASAARKAARDAKARKAVAEGLKDVHGPGGNAWEPHELPDDGTYYGRRAREQAKQVFKAGEHEVVIESDLSPEHTKGLLGDIGQMLDRAAPTLDGQHVRFIVPKGDPEFRPSKGVGAYVHVGDATRVFINPRVANEEKASSFYASAVLGHFTPGGKALGIKGQRQYTILHELGHIADNHHKHTRETRDNWSPYASGQEELHAALTHDHGHSVYGKRNPAEGYAEAFADYHLRGPGSSAIGDAYAQHYGWKAPALPPIKAVDSPRPVHPEDDISKPLTEAERKAYDPDGRYGPGPKQPNLFGGATFGGDRNAGLPPTRPWATKTLQDAAPSRPSRKINPRDITTYGNLGGGLGSIHGADSPFAGSTIGSEHGRLLGEAAARQTKPLSSTVKGAREALVTLPPDVQKRLLKGRNIEDLSSDDLRAILRAAIDHAKARRAAK